MLYDRTAVRSKLGLVETKFGPVELDNDRGRTGPGIDWTAVLPCFSQSWTAVRPV